MDWGGLGFQSEGEQVRMKQDGGREAERRNREGSAGAWSTGENFDTMIDKALPGASRLAVNERVKGPGRRDSIFNARRAQYLVRNFRGGVNISEFFLMKSQSSRWSGVWAKIAPEPASCYHDF